LGGRCAPFDVTFIDLGTVRPEEAMVAEPMDALDILMGLTVFSEKILCLFPSIQFCVSSKETIIGLNNHRKRTPTVPCEKSSAVTKPVKMGPARYLSVVKNEVYNLMGVAVIGP
jgi:hypothetical protein